MNTESHQISKESRSSFYYAFNLLPEPKREAMHTVYAFCRRTDDIVDEGNESDDEKFLKLHKWRVELEKSLAGNSEFSLLNRLSKIISQFNIPLEPFFELIIGMEMDLKQKRYLSFEDLVTYCYRVASTVGLMCIEIFGYKNKSTREYAVNLGLALQLTNIIRDVKKDADQGRIYIPQEDFDRFGYTEKDLMDYNYNQRYIDMMALQAHRARDYFIKANRSLNIEDKPLLFPARAMQHIYSRLLKKLEGNQFNVFSDSINVSTFEKIYIALGVWTKYSLIY